MSFAPMPRRPGLLSGFGIREYQLPGGQAWRTAIPYEEEIGGLLGTNAMGAYLGAVERPDFALSPQAAIDELPSRPAPLNFDFVQPPAAFLSSSTLSSPIPRSDFRGRSVRAMPASMMPVEERERPGTTSPSSASASHPAFAREEFGQSEDSDLMRYLRSQGLPAHYAQARPGQTNARQPALPRRRQPAQGVDWEFITGREGGVAIEGYVPRRNDGVDANSGVTIGGGVDLGHQNEQGLRALGVNDETIRRLRPYFGRTGEGARQFAQGNPLTVTAGEAEDLTERVHQREYDDVARRFGEATGGRQRFEDLPRERQTVILSVAHQYGTNLANNTPNFWRQVTGGRWQEAHDNLMNFGDADGPRRRREAELLRPGLEAERRDREEQRQRRRSETSGRGAGRGFGPGGGGGW